LVITSLSVYGVLPGEPGHVGTSHALPLSLRLLALQALLVGVAGEEFAWLNTLLKASGCLRFGPGNLVARRP
jgi:hypothetical protein